MCKAHISEWKDESTSVTAYLLTFRKSFSKDSRSGECITKKKEGAEAAVPGRRRAQFCPGRPDDCRKPPAFQISAAARSTKFPAVIIFYSSSLFPPFSLHLHTSKLGNLSTIANILFITSVPHLQKDNPEPKGH